MVLQALTMINCLQPNFVLSVILFKFFFKIILNVYLFGERTTNNGDYKKQINKCFPLI